jgi:hypothetical protein
LAEILVFLAVSDQVFVEVSFGADDHWHLVVNHVVNLKVAQPHIHLGLGYLHLGVLFFRRIVIILDIQIIHANIEQFFWLIIYD